MFDGGFVVGRPDDRDDVESNGEVGEALIFLQIGGEAGEAEHLGLVDADLGRGIFSGAGFDFDDDEGAAVGVESKEIGFVVAASGVVLKDAVAGLAEEAGCSAFASPAEGFVSAFPEEAKQAHGLR